MHASPRRPEPPPPWSSTCFRAGAHPFRRLLRKCRRGVLIVTDRYPQAEVPGFRFDGPQLAKTPGGNGLVRRLAASELRLYQWMAAHVPLLVIRLDIDEATAHARKPDHGLDELRDKIAVMRRLRYNGATIVDIDARRPYPEVLAQALAAIDGALASPQTGPASAVASAQRRADQTPPPDRI
ncbi:hypothetical protein [Aerosticca soli]|uniref:Conserved ATP-binding protein YghS n=1 Tax=Aerosticca soli TaxID=2010829 RepID=A0A2Z6E7T1_9GAMM|nr:hypothetical protein [Aerosticca soli]BBD80568.1 conserved ATP-binding protein YghS [Aerosticca soli]